MKKLLILAVIFLMASCKKEYHCECTNTNGTYIAGYIEATKKKAKAHCESLSTSETTCTFK